MTNFDEKNEDVALESIAAQRDSEKQNFKTHDEVWNESMKKTMTIYNKLVRDGIPDYIRSKNQPFKSHVATDAEYMEKLYEKLQEEAAELASGPEKEELADLLEVIEAIKKLNGWTTDEVEIIRLEKLAKRGGFEDRIILEES